MLNLTLFFILFISIANLKASEDEYRLLQDLRKEYDSLERPVPDHKQAIDVKLRIVLQQILEIDEKNQMVTIVLWLQSTWKDYKMRWEPNEYGNITTVALPHDFLWKPDILLYNSADENFDARFDANYVVDFEGSVLHAPPALIKISCDMDITWFPFDEQICFLKYGAWTYNGAKVNLSIDKTDLDDRNHRMDLQYYVENGAWELVGTPASRIISHDNNELKIDLYFYLYLKRKVMYYGINWIIPSILFMLSNVLCFSLPSASGEKITLQTNNLLSVIFFLGMAVSVTPPTSTSVPFIGAFFAIQMVLLGSSFIITILVINISFRSPKTHKMTPFLRLVFLEWIPYLTLMSRPGKSFQKPNKKKGEEDDEENLIGGSVRSAVGSLRSVRSSTATIYTFKHLPYGGINHLIRGNSTHSLQRFKRAINPQKSSIDKIDEEKNLALNGAIEDEKKEPGNEENENPSEERTLALLRESLMQLNESLKDSKKQLLDEEEEELNKADWRFMAMAIDRACMYVYAVLSIFLPIFMYSLTPKDKPRLFENNTFIYV